MVEHALYWTAVDSPDEGRYLTTILNSGALAEAVAPLQARGQHNPRHFDLHVFALGFPRYDASAPLHQQLAQLGAQAEAAAQAIELDPAWQFQKARRVVREGLAAAGITAAVDEAVQELLLELAPPPAIAS